MKKQYTNEEKIMYYQQKIERLRKLNKTDESRVLTEEKVLEIHQLMEHIEVIIELIKKSLQNNKKAP